MAEIILLVIKHHCKNDTLYSKLTLKSLQLKKRESNCQSLLFLTYFNNKIHHGIDFIKQKNYTPFFPKKLSSIFMLANGYELSDLHFLSCSETVGVSYEKMCENTPNMFSERFQENQTGILKDKTVEYVKLCWFPTTGMKIIIM